MGVWIVWDIIKVNMFCESHSFIVICFISQVSTVRVCACKCVYVYVGALYMCVRMRIHCFYRMLIEVRTAISNNYIFPVIMYTT